MEPSANRVTSSPNIRILPLREDDIPDLVRLARAIWYAHFPGIITVEQIEYMLDQRYRPEVIREQLANHTAWWDKLLLDETLVAFACCKMGEHRDAMKLDKLYVRYDLRRRGYGSLLLRHVEERARSRRSTRFYLQVNKNNASAIRFYLGNGFAISKAARFDIGRGFSMDDYVMSKALPVA
jgi:diamine N-acetyltransferase